MEKLWTPTTALALPTLGNEILSLEKKSSSSDERPTRGKVQRKPEKSVIKYSTPVNNVSPREIVADFSRILTKSTSSEEIKLRNTGKRIAIKRLRFKKKIQYSGENEENEEPFVVRSRRKNENFAEDSRRELEKSAGRILGPLATSKKIEYFGKSAWETEEEKEENGKTSVVGSIGARDKIAEKLLENPRGTAEDPAKKNLTGQLLKSSKRIEYFGDSAWETEEEREENAEISVVGSMEAWKKIEEKLLENPRRKAEDPAKKKHTRQPLKSGKEVEYFGDSAWETEEGKAKKSAIGSAESKGEPKKVPGEDCREKLANLSEDTVDMVDRKPEGVHEKLFIRDETTELCVESQRSPEKIRREPPRNDQVFHSPVLTSRVGKFDRKFDRESPLAKFHRLPSLQIYDEIDEINEIDDNLHVRKDINDNLKIYPVRKRPCALNSNFPTFGPTNSKDLLWEKFVEENQEELNDYMHNYWARTEHRRKILDENLTKTNPQRLRKRFFVSKNSSNSAAPKKHQNIAKETSEKSRESSTDVVDLSIYDFDTDVFYDEGSKIKIWLNTIKEIPPIQRSVVSGKKSKRKARISAEIRNCNRIIRECNREIRYYEKLEEVRGYKEQQWSSGHSFQDWEDTQRAFIKPTKSGQSSRHISKSEALLVEWTGENAEVKEIERSLPTIPQRLEKTEKTIPRREDNFEDQLQRIPSPAPKNLAEPSSATRQPTYLELFKWSDDSSAENSEEISSTRKRKVAIVSDIPFFKRVKIVSVKKI